MGFHASTLRPLRARPRPAAPPPAPTLSFRIRWSGAPQGRVPRVNPEVSTPRLPTPVGGARALGVGAGPWWRRPRCPRAERTLRRPLAVSASWAVVLEKQDGGDGGRSGGRGGHGAAGPAGADAGEQRGTEPHQGGTPSSRVFSPRGARKSRGRLVASLVAEFLQFFNLDFTLAVFQPETSTLQGLEGRENLARDLGIIEAEGTVGGPLLLEVIRRCQQKEKGPTTGKGTLDLADVPSPPTSPEGKTSAQTTPSKKANNEANQSDTSVSLSEPKSKSSLHLLSNETKIGSFLSNKTLDGKDKAGLCPDADDMEGDSFFDDPIPKPEKTYGLRNEPRKQAGSLASLSDAPPLKSGLSSLVGTPSLKDSESKGGNIVLKDLKLISDKIGSLGLGAGEDDDYVDDFNSTSHRSEKSEISIGEEIEEDLSVEIDDINTSEKLDDLTQDLTVSQLSDVADYLEDVA
ncbi:centrosomal protein 43 isoform X2 [Callithrix jacchus]|uniref:Centrosomal protein 43 n=1 Tax=Callithrix jacchus TaxID=9483 RepID=A0A5F4WJQ5_CALJA|nr:centrosomal protein 43 isoform X3 [Callithrix jacchus]